MKKKMCLYSADMWDNINIFVFSFCIPDSFGKVEAMFLSPELYGQIHAIYFLSINEQFLHFF